MDMVSRGSSAARHGAAAALESLLLVAIVLALLFGVGPLLGLAPAGGPAALAARPMSGVITVAGPVAHGETTVATVNPGGSDVYVFVQCYAPEFGGDYVYAAYFPVDASNQATLGPLWSTLWTAGGADCLATEGYFTRNGFGKWVAQAQTTFTVDP